jgi:hypothetical protein
MVWIRIGLSPFIESNCNEASAFRNTGVSAQRADAYEFCEISSTVYKYSGEAVEMANPVGHYITPG